MSHYTINLNKRNIKTNCNIHECLPGGISTKLSETKLECNDKLLEKRDECSYMKTDIQCTNLIRKYHVINDKGTIIETFLLNVDLNFIQKLEDNLMIKFNNWIVNFIHSSKSFEDLVQHSNYKNISTFWSEFEKCTKLVNEELLKREEHLQKCVCLSNESHSNRIITLRNLKVSIDVFKLEISKEMCNKDNIKFVNQSLYFYYFIHKYTSLNSMYISEFTKEVQDIIKRTLQNRIMIDVDDNGDIISLPIGEIQGLIPFRIFMKDKYFIEKQLQQQLKTKLDSLYLDDHLFNTNMKNHVSCIQFNSKGEVFAIGVDYNELSAYVLSQFKFNASPKFLQTYIEKDNKLLMYKSCFYGTIKYNQALMMKLCNILSTLNIDKDILYLLQQICFMISGDGSKIGLGWIYTPQMESKIKELVPSLQKNYLILKEKLPNGVIFKDSSYKPTGDLFKDLKYLKESFIIELIIDLEYEWKKFEKKYKHNYYEEDEKYNKRIKKQKIKNHN